MTATKKLFLAAVLLAAGYGVARLMGRPDAPWLATHTADVPVASRSDSSVGHPMTPALASPPTDHGARLVPDFSGKNPYQNPPDAPASNSPQTLSIEVQPGMATVTSPPWEANNDYQQSHANIAPRAKLRDEAPRPLDFDLHETSAVYARPAPPSQTADVVPLTNARSAAADWSASGLTSAEFVPNTGSGATINAAYSQPADAPSVGAVAPPPWPESVEQSGPRTHVVVDGDSLERLAARYLDDANRSNEIYEANRELLASPDLLPIGAELVIPAHTNRTAFEGISPQSSLASDPSLRAATHGGIVRVRPIPSSVHVLPRAQLLPPVRAD